MFDKIKTTAEVKAEYLRLMEAASFTGANTEKVDKAYLKRLEELNGQIIVGSDGKEHTYHFNPKTETRAIATIQTLLEMKMDDVKIELIGTWVWASGTTKPHKEELKKLGMLWHSKRGRWYWRVRGGPRKFSGLAFATVRKMHGAKEYEAEKKQPASKEWRDF